MNFLLHLINISVFNIETWQFNELNSIVMAAQNKSEILTVALFGSIYDIEPYIRVLEQNNVPKLVITRNYGDINFHHGSGVNKGIFFIARAPFENAALWNHMNNAFLGIHGHVRGIFITSPHKKKNILLNMKQHFEWCRQKGFTNALILVDYENIIQRKFEIYSYNHFLQEKLINMTNFNKSDLFPDKFRNLQKYKIRTAAQFDPPRVFEASNSTGKSKDHLLGYIAMLFQAFLKEYNADMELLYFARNKTYDITEIIQRIENDEIDLGLNPYIPFKNAYLSYPLRMLQRCIVVPFPEELSKYRFFIMPFQTKVWLSFLATWLILSCAKLFGWCLKYKKVASISTDIGQTFLEVWRLMMYLPTSAPYCYKDLKWFNALWFTFIAVMGFIFSNLYLASLTSYFSGLIFKPLINTLAELIERRISIDVVDYEIPAIVNNRDLPKDFADLLRPRNALVLLNEILALRANQSYTDLEDRIQFVFTQQQHLQQPISQVVKECIATMPLGFLMPVHSQFEEPLNRFIFRSTAAGLLNKWILDAIQQGYSSGVLVMRVPKLEVARPLTLKHFQFGWYILAGGYIAGFVAFLLENIKRIFKHLRISVVYY